MNWLKISRPKTFAASIAPVLIGFMVAVEKKADIAPFDWFLGVIILLTAIFIQIFSNLANDLYDFRRSEDSSPARLGPSRAVSAGLITEKQLIKAIYISLIPVVAGGLYLVYLGGWAIAVIGLTAVLFALLYSATNRSLSHTGLADIFCFMYYGPIATMGTTYLITNSWDATAFILGAGCGANSIALLTINNLRDIEEDRAHAKLTLVVRGGETFGKVYYALAVCLAPVTMWFGTHWICAMIFAIVLTVNNLVAFFLLYNKKFNMLLGYAGMYNLCYAAFIIAYYHIA
ncbi:MAG: 1,4-dihydroxy-2-naphthoate octaprenyltransferase [Bacteroidaceae bacterium]|nr:1,4-dihydroxy-2-naphthoate octaprenyltransferase [Bacteroidaceae bacterium]